MVYNFNINFWECVVIMERKDGAPKNYKKSEKTKRKIVNALLDILETKPLDKVTIQEICDRADVHRTTFYKHFGSIFDVINGMSAETTKELANVMEMLEKPEIWFDFFADFVDKYRHQIKNINKTKYKEMLISPLAVILYEFYYRLFQLENKKVIEGMKKEWMIRYHVSGTLAIVEHWLDDDCSKDECRKGIEGLYKMIFK